MRIRPLAALIPLSLALAASQYDKPGYVTKVEDGLMHLCTGHGGDLGAGFFHRFGGAAIDDHPGQGPLAGMRFTLTTVQQHLQMLSFGGHAQGDDIDAGQDFDCIHRGTPCSRPS